MAKNTNRLLTKEIIYQVYHRNYSNEGTFKKITEDLDRLVDLGVDIVYLLPIHPIGELARKGILGSPYSIKDFKGINPELGTLEDFNELIEESHKRGLKVMIDIVFNHSSKDHPWIQEHPEYYYLNKEGHMANKVGDWSDITDLDYNHLPLWDVMVDVLTYWAKLGVDGYRCDVASLVPLDFWLKAREEVAKINPDHIWLAESVHTSFLKVMRDGGFVGHSDAEVYQAFDICYDYDIWHEVESFFKEKTPFARFVEKLQLQEVIYPANYIKARAYENHDIPRLMKLTNDVNQTKNWVTAIFGLKGMAFLNAGIETLTDKLPNLFDKDPIDWSKTDEAWVDQLKTLIQLKKSPIMSEYTSYEVFTTPFDLLHIEYRKDDEKLVIVSNITSVKDDLNVTLDDGDYINVFNGKTVRVMGGKLRLSLDPIIIHVK